MYKNRFFTATILFFLMGASFAQDRKSEVSVQGTGFFTKDTDGPSIHQEGSTTGGMLTGYRYHINRWFAAEANYGYARNTQKYFTTAGLARVQANVHEITGAGVVTFPTWREKFHAFALAGGGGLVFDPTGNVGGTFPGATRETKGVFLYGGGVDYDLTRRFAFRAEYRGLVYKAPSFNVASFNADQITHVAQPSAGIVFRF